MSSKKNNSVNIKKYKTKREFNLGIFLFAIVFIYLVVTIILYFTGDRISVYEVREGSIVKDNSYTGLIIRKETAVTAESSGYISYYQAENSKIKRGMIFMPFPLKSLIQAAKQTPHRENTQKVSP